MPKTALKDALAQKASQAFFDTTSAQQNIIKS